ncbi:Flagellar biosynthetic protein FliO [Sphingomonas sp. 8AM]|nr:Flagellar biosynthetic protein FliO [Sphingomonas sp. 8AM]
MLRAIGALSLVLGLLGGALWIVRRYDIHLPTQLFAARSGERRLVLVERLALDGRRAVMLIRCDDREHAVLVAPEGVVTLHRTRRVDDLPMEANDA